MRQIRCVAVPLETELLLGVHDGCGTQGERVCGVKRSINPAHQQRRLLLLLCRPINSVQWSCNQSYAFYEFCNDGQEEEEIHC